MKKIIYATLVLLFVFSPGVSAHTGLTSSTPADGDNITVDVQEIVLEFNTKIETTSTVKVFNENEEEINLSDTQISDNTITGIFMSPLNNGTYTVDWKIIGADGHPIQGSYSFTVSKEEVVDPVETEELEETQEVPVVPIEEPIDEPIEQVTEDSSKIASNDVLVLILVVLFAVAGGFVGWLMGRRKNK